MVKKNGPESAIYIYSCARMNELKNEILLYLSLILADQLKRIKLHLCPVRGGLILIHLTLHWSLGSVKDTAISQTYYSGKKNTSSGHSILRKQSLLVKMFHYCAEETRSQKSVSHEKKSMWKKHNDVRVKDWLHESTRLFLLILN